MRHHLRFHDVTVWNKSSLIGVPGNKCVKPFFHLQQLSIIIPSRSVFWHWRRLLKSENIAETSLKFLDRVNCHCKTSPFSFKKQKTELYNFIHLPSLGHLYPTWATLLKLWSHNIHRASSLDMACTKECSCNLNSATYRSINMSLDGWGNTWFENEGKQNLSGFSWIRCELLNR